MTAQEDLRKAEERPDDLIAAVLRDHAEIKQRFAEVMEATDREAKEEAFRRLARKIVVHETAEQELVHPLARAKGAGTIVDERLREESKGESALSDLEKMGVDDPNFDAKFREFQKEVLEHAESEEKNEHPRIDEAVSSHRLQQMATPFRAAEAAAPTHPHPHGPTSATGNLVAGPALALMDRVRDAVREAMNKIGD